MIVYDEAELRKPCQPASKFEMEKIVVELVKELANHKNGVGLSAPQIGINKTVAIVKVRDLIILHNPIIIKSTGRIKTNEGCLSFPDQYVDTVRSHTVEIETHGGFRYKFSSLDKLSTLECVAIQHEIDHLNQILFFDRAIKNES